MAVQRCSPPRTPGTQAGRLLLATGDAPLVELAPHVDALEGVAPQQDGSWRGRNVVGVLLVERLGQLRLLDGGPA